MNPISPTMKTFLLLLLSTLAPCLAQSDSIPRPAVSSPADSLTYPSPASSVNRPKAVLTVDTLPQFPGGPRALVEFARIPLHYPTSSVYTGGIVVRPTICFTVDKEGYVRRPRIVRSINPFLDSLSVMHFTEASPRWKPAVRDGHSVSYLYTSPVWIDNCYAPVEHNIRLIIAADTLPASSLVAQRGKVLCNLTPMSGITVCDSLHPERVTTTDERGNFTLTTSPDCLLVLTAPGGRRRLVYISKYTARRKQYIIFQW